MEDFFQTIKVLNHPGKKVLATIVDVKGSAYKREGSSMIFMDDGTQIGMVSAGCVEADLVEWAKKVLESEEPQLVRYDLTEEGDIGWGKGCNGTIDILLEPINRKLEEDMKLVKKLLDNNIKVAGFKSLGHLGEYVFVPEKGEAFGCWEGSFPIINFASKSGLMTDGVIFQHIYLPKPRLIVFGAGPDAKSLVSLAAETGFSVTVCDWREALCQEQNFPAADELLIGFPREILRNVSFSPYDFVVIMTHHFQRDQEILWPLLDENIRYLGVLGPRERTARLLNGEKIPEWVHSPVGLSIGAKGPAEIAISIIAEMIEAWRKPVREQVEHLWTIPD
ncbi:XdhC family protein [Neobacillus sp. SAB-20_R2A]|uniref:XdhC family protein n=1 Tax=Neobacillus sp. SAB-20_R2A TaxID=3120519 RepID=UPI003C6E66C0